MINFGEFKMIKLVGMLMMLSLSMSVWAEDVQVEAITVDAQGKMFTATATFAGGLSLDGKNFTATVDASRIQTVFFETKITLDDADVGKAVQFLLVIGSDNTPPYDGGDAIFNNVNSKNKLTPVNLYATPDVWMAQLTEPFRAKVVLKKTMTIKLGQRKLPLAGKYFVYAAYRTSDGAITYSPQPLIVTIN